VVTVGRWRAPENRLAPWSGDRAGPGL